MEQACSQVLSGMSMEEVRAMLGDPDWTHDVSFDHDHLTSWIYHADPDPLCVWFDAADKVRLASRNCSTEPADFF